VLHQFADFCLDGWVSVYEFEVFVLSFGPLSGSVARVLSAFDSGILAGEKDVARKKSVFTTCLQRVHFVV
jgi:hypothetical protein